MPYSDPSSPKAVASLRAARRRHYAANAAAYKERAAAKRLVLLELAARAKEKPCADCDTEYPWWAMEFDHIDPTQKVANVSVLVKRGNRKALEEEIAKCEVVCPTCHRLRHPPPSADLLD